MIYKKGSLTRIDIICEKIWKILKLDQMDKRNINEKLQQEIVLLSFGNKVAVKKYYLKKIKMIFLLIIFSVFLTFLCFLGEIKMEKNSVTDYLKRPDYGAGDRLEYLEVQAEGENEKYEMEIMVRERTYTDQEKQEFLNQAILELDKIIQGENESMDEVRKNLILPENMFDGTVKISWVTIPYGVIDESGEIIGAEDGNGTIVELQGTLSCGTLEQIYSVYAKVFPPQLNEKEQFITDIRKAVEKEDIQKSHEENLRLPEQVGKKTLIWSQNKTSAAGTVFSIMLIVIVCVYIQMDNEIHKKADKRKNQLMLDYPDLMWKMTMLLGAGQNIRGTFIRMAEDYRKKQESVRWVYEEVCITCQEMQSGISEAQAYERFGKRCQLPEYIRIGTILSQNLKKGSKGLTGMLEREAETAMNERKHHARRIGEQAGTKLLLPMVMMLSVVLAILLVPAFMAF